MDKRLVANVLLTLRPIFCKFFRHPLRQANAAITSPKLILQFFMFVCSKKTFTFRVALPAAFLFASQVMSVVQAQTREVVKLQAESQLQQMTAQQIDAKIKEYGLTREQAEAKAKELGIDLNVYLCACRPSGVRIDNPG